MRSEGENCKNSVSDHPYRTLTKLRVLLHRLLTNWREHVGMTRIASAEKIGELVLESAVRILIIDDDEKLCVLLKKYLEPLGYRVDAVHNGTDGLERALAGEHAAIIMDVMMP